MADSKSPEVRNRAWTAETRDKLIKAGVAEEMLRAFQGQPLPIRNAAGKVVGETEVPPLSDRLTLGKILLGKIMPDLRAVEIDANVEGGGPTLVLQMAAGVAPPGALKDVTPAPAQIDDQTPVTEIEPEAAPVRPRRKRRGEA